MTTSRAVLRSKDTTPSSALYMSFDLGDRQWHLSFGDGRSGVSRYTVVAGKKKGSRQLEVNYSYGKRTITVPPNVPIVLITGGQRSMVKVGTPVFMVVQKGANGQLMTGSVSVGENGAKLAM